MDMLCFWDHKKIASKLVFVLLKALSTLPDSSSTGLVWTLLLITHPSLQLDSSSIQCLVVGVCFYFPQLLDEGYRVAYRKGKATLFTQQIQYLLTFGGKKL
ncbi:hypothetical protein H671_5g15040 [Cricetulus griseus]|uniref:Uncharacterized protein n=1 Tax=Cricetulus griseus TaxID=10029 RepID=A0A061I271_CRIGR|nr:hypothetical protein H671_5g15040 [Cricetulus griseus]